MCVEGRCHSLSLCVCVCVCVWCVGVEGVTVWRGGVSDSGSSYDATLENDA